MAFIKTNCGLSASPDLLLPLQLLMRGLDSLGVSFAPSLVIKGRI